MRVHNQQGFTLPELLVVIIGIALLSGLAAFFLRPASFTLQNAESERRTAAAKLVQMLTHYHADKGTWPEGITTNPQTIGSEEKHLNICKALVPQYSEDMPFDPLVGIKLTADMQDFTDQPCTADVSYDSGFKVNLSSDSQHITVTAPKVEDFAEIKITR